jgi:DNA-directed RNA polymerase specialized sigma24 family protein
MTMHNLIQPNLAHRITCYGAAHGVTKQDLADFVAEVQVRTIEHLQQHSPPKDDAGWQGLVLTIGKNLLIDRCKRKKTHEKHDAGLCDAPDDHGPLLPSGEQRDPVDARRQLDVLLDMFRKGEMPPLGKEILEGVAENVKLPAIGRELGLPVKEVRSRLKEMRKRYFTRLQMLGLMVMMLMVFAVFAGPAGVVGQGVGGDAGARVTQPEKDAAALRKEALRACQEHRWDECEAKLRAARELEGAQR